MTTKNNVFFALVLGLILLFGVAFFTHKPQEIVVIPGGPGPEGEDFIGSCAHWTGAYGEVTQCPAVLDQVGNDVFINVTSFFNETKNVDVALEFPGDIANIENAWTWGNRTAWSPIWGNQTNTITCNTTSYGIINSAYVWCYNATDDINYSFYCPVPRDIKTNASGARCSYNQSIQIGEQGYYVEDWVSIMGKFQKGNYLDHTFYYIQNVSFDPNETRMVKLRVNLPPNTAGKFLVHFKLTDDTIADALSSGRRVTIDPSWNSSFYQLYMNIGCPMRGCDYNVTTPVFINNATVMARTTSCIFHIIRNNSDTNYSEVPIEITNCNYNNNASINFRYYNYTGYDWWLAYKNDTDVNVSNSITTWVKKDDFDSWNSSYWSVYTAAPSCGYGIINSTLNGTHCNLSYATAQYGMYRTTTRTASAEGPFCLYFDFMFPGGANGGNITDFLEDYGSGTVKGGWFHVAALTGAYTPSNTTWVYTTSTTLVGAFTYTPFGRHMMLRQCYNGTVQYMNISYQWGGAREGEYSTNTWTFMNDSAYTSANVQPFVGGVASVAATNITVWWFAESNGTYVPWLSSFGREILSGGLTSSQVTMCSGLTCTALGTVYHNNPTALNASGNCSASDWMSPVWGNFTFYVNGTKNVAYITYNWIANNTNYTNTSITGTYLNKSDTWYVSLLCSNSTHNSSWASSTAFTVNNTAPTISAPSITSNDTYYLTTSILTCSANASYSDADSDSLNLSAPNPFRWYRNGTFLTGYRNQTLNLSWLPAVTNGENFSCEQNVTDSGYQPLSFQMNSTNVTIASAPTSSTSSQQFYYLNNYTDWAHYATDAVGQCAFEVIPMDNQSVTSVSFKVQKNYTEYAVGDASTWVAGTRDPNDWAIWLSPKFIPNMYGQYNCSAYITFSDATTNTTNGYFNVSFGAATAACEWLKDCTVAVSASVPFANVSHYSLTIPAGVTLSTTGTYGTSTLFVIQDALTVSGTLSSVPAATGSAGLQMVIQARNITNYGVIQFFGTAGTTHQAGGAGGSLIIQNTTTFNNTASGVIAGYGGNGGSGQDSCPDYGYGNGAIGGAGGYFNVSGNVSEFYSAGTISLAGGQGGAGVCTGCGYQFGTGGAGGAAGYLQTDAFRNYFNSTTLDGGHGGDGSNDPDCLIWCGYANAGGPGGAGGSASSSNMYFSRNTTTLFGAVTASGGIGGRGFLTSACAVAASGSNGVNNLFNASAYTGTGSFTPTQVKTDITGYSFAKPASPTITAPVNGTNMTIGLQNISATWTTISGLTYEVEILNYGNETFITPNRGEQNTVAYPTNTSGVATINTHRILNNTLVTMRIRAYNASNRGFSDWSNITMNLSYINTTVGKFTVPAGTTFNTNDIEYWCSYNDTTAAVKPVYGATVKVFIDGIQHNTTYYAGRGMYLYNSTGLDLITSGNHTWNCTFSRADYFANNSNTSWLLITGFGIYLPTGISSFRWTCPFPTFYNATPAGQKVGVGIYRIRNYNVTNNKNYTIWINGTIPTGINFYAANQSLRSKSFILTNVPQKILWYVNTTNLTSYVWMWIDCIAAPVGSPTVKFGFNETDT